MKKYKKLILILTALFAASHADAQRGGRGGRGGGGVRGGGPGGGYQPSRPVNRGPVGTPGQGIGNRPGTLPANQPGNGGINRPGNGNGPGPIRPNPGQPPTRPGGRPGAGDIGNRAPYPPGHFPGTPGTRPNYGGYHKVEMTQNINNHFYYRPNVGYPFSRNWYANAHWHYNRWPYWTAAATGAAWATWIGRAYNGYGSATQIAYYPVEAAPAEVYDQSVTEPKQAVEQGQVNVPDDAEWLNVGTYGLIPMNQKDIHFGIQLASTKDGMVRGIQWNFADDSSVEIEGSIVKETLRVAWQVKDSPDSKYFETTMDQLTQQESYVNVYDPKTKALVSWQMIQIDEKDLPPQSN